MAGSLSSDCEKECGWESGSGPGELARLRREAVLFCRLRLIPPMVAGVGRTGAGAEIPTTEVIGPPTVEEPAVAAVKLRVLVLEELRWWRRPVDGMEKPEPDRRC